MKFVMQRFECFGKYQTIGLDMKQNESYIYDSFCKMNSFDSSFFFFLILVTYRIHPTYLFFQMQVNFTELILTVEGKDTDAFFGLISYNRSLVCS